MEGMPDDEQVAAVIALAIESYLALSTEENSVSLPYAGRWTFAGRLEGQGLRPASGGSRRHWGRDVS